MSMSRPLIAGSWTGPTFGPGTAERRRQHRLSHPPLFVNGLGAVARDVSREGIGLLVDGPVRKGERHRLVLRDALDDSVHEVQVEVMWYSPGSERGWGRAGCRWVGLTPETEWWLQSRFLAWLGALDGASQR